ncbi:MAG TPA: hypothetical protein VE011_01050 [Candidatus Dormibacteraeota bacterium]|nr:hypothetical protein [Candidatus Dormibacteraeota bacterium]
MTLPFRRRHHDDDAAHDRAHALISNELLEPLSEAEAGWLAGHLGGCPDCRRDRDAYLADRALVRSLRDHAPEPPRDLWARTSAALDREARNRPARSTEDRTPRRFPLAPAAGVLVLLVVIGAAFAPRLVPPTITALGTSSPQTTADAGQPTPFLVAAAPVGWVRQTRDGSWELVISDVQAVCPHAQSGCQSLGEDVHGRPVALSNPPASVSISPDEHHLVVESLGQGAAPNKILVVPVPAPTPAATPEVPATVAPQSGVPETAPTSPSPIPSSTIAAGVIEIASGVTVVGDTAYSDDGKWLAFSARPANGSAGPDLYLWHVGDPVALPVTTDHQTYFSAWFGNQVLASRVGVAAAPLASNDPQATGDLSSAAPLPAASADISASADAPSAAPAIVGHPSSFLLDPSTLTRSEITQPDVWLPVVDPTGRFVAFWSGTLTASPDGRDWRPGEGHLVLDGWSTGVAPAPSASADAASSTAATTSAATTPAATTPPVGPIGSPVTIVEGRAATFSSKFDPTGTRLAIWVADDHDPTVGRLYLQVLDPTTGAVDQTIAPLPGVPALRRFSIEEGRLAWVSPPGQDGQDSSVQVLGWSHDNFGEVRTIPSKDLFIVR